MQNKRIDSYLFCLDINYQEPTYFDSADTNSRTVYKCRCIFDDNNRIFFTISQLGDSNEHHKLRFNGELRKYTVFCMQYTIIEKKFIIKVT